MADIKSQFYKLTRGIQKGYEEGVNKIQISQEVLNLKEQVAQSEEKRLKLIVFLGEKYYLEYRNGEVEDENIKEICSKIVDIDKKIFKDLKIVEEKTKNNGKNVICECGATVNSQDEFCRTCGKRVQPHNEESIEKIVCGNCGEETPIKSNYCNCCGKKLS